MIKTTELRLGNLVLEKKIQAWQEVFYLCKDIIAFDDGTEDTFREEDVDGIPLTPDVFKRCEGFDIAPDREHWFIKHFGFCLIFDGKDWCLKYRIDSNAVIAYIKYLHQLQNVYLLITGKELAIKL